MYVVMDEKRLEPGSIAGLCWASIPAFYVFLVSSGGMNANLLLQSTTYPGLVNGAGYLLFFGGIILIGAWLSWLTRSQPVR